jgi:type VI secretion system secreted protein Hcp
MASNYYLQIGGVNGESSAPSFQKQIELDSWSFGASSAADVGSGGLAAGTPSLSDFSCSFDMDSSSYQILKALYQGTHIDTVTFSGQKVGGDGNPYTYLTVIMTNCFITSYATGGAGTSTAVSNSLSLAYQKIEFDYSTQDTSNGQVTKAGSATFDVAAGTAS